MFPPKQGSRTAVYFRGRDVRKQPFQGHFIRYEGEGETPKGILPPWRKDPEGWFELWPLEPLYASSSGEAKDKYLPMLPYVEDGSRDDEFRKIPYQPPVVPQLIKDIEHPTYVSKARIVQYPDALFSVGYLVYAPNGRYMPASTPSISAELEWEWGVTRVQTEEGEELRTLADCLESAEDIAAIELEQLVAQDPEIKRR
jgi:hypothetical protein